MTVEYFLKKLGLDLEDTSNDSEDVYTVRFNLLQGLAVDVKMPLAVLMIFTHFSPDEQSLIVRELVAMFSSESIGVKELPFEDDDSGIQVMLESTHVGFQITLDWSFSNKEH